MVRLLDRLLGRERRQDAAGSADDGTVPLAEPGAWAFGEDDEDPWLPR